ncbi:MAG: hypothetical protein IJ390_14950 [Lachnospiraceae bacterium]|nr:hypothetical protein [Lachnospiraceae bacterium]
MNPMKILQIKNAWDKFSANHPKFAPFLKAVSSGVINSGTIIEINVTTADGRTVNTNLKIKEEDMDLFREMKDLMS